MVAFLDRPTSPLILPRSMVQKGSIRYGDLQPVVLKIASRFYEIMCLLSICGRDLGWGGINNFYRYFFSGFWLSKSMLLDAQDFLIRISMAQTQDGSGVE
ncbi:hypothetical protein RRG08_042815 [Elysia crispata]|uniref:Uncharacterized protein n=1 Tax=Elysia crispata TaxID=231223 RepID=A0AAE1CX01_9GAST|nr:hypothetical protein RRG08_042815 [Elysia crispata]